MPAGTGGRCSCREEGAGVGISERVMTRSIYAQTDAHNDDDDRGHELKGVIRQEICRDLSAECAFIFRQADGA